MAESCSICCDDFDNTKIIKFHCNECKTDMCTNCCKRYWETYNTTKCPGFECNLILGRRDIADVFPPNYLNGDFTKLRTKILFDSRKVFYKDVQMYICSGLLLDKIIDCDNDIRNYIENEQKLVLEDIQEKAKNLHSNIDVLKDFLSKNPKCTQYLISDNFKIVRENNNYDKEVIRRTMRIRDYLPNNDPNKGKEQKDTIPTFYGYCGKNDCNGILNEDYKCLICTSLTCKKCMALKFDPNEDKNRLKEIKDLEEKNEVIPKNLLTKKGPHICDPNEVESIKAIRQNKDTKNCPNESCGIPISKIEGCYQMFCTNCHILFEWKNLKILKERAHNPHALEWMRRTNQEINYNENNNLCAGIITIQRYRIIKKDVQFRDYITFPTRKSLQLIENLEQVSGHIRGTTMDNISNKVNNYSQELLRLDRMYISKQLEEKSYKIRLASKEKEKEMLQNIYDVFEILCEQTDYVYSKFCEEVNCLQIEKDFNTPEELEKIIKTKSSDVINTFEDLILFVNNLFIKNEKIFKRMTYQIALHRIIDPNEENYEINLILLNIKCTNRKEELPKMIMKHTDKKLNKSELSELYVVNPSNIDIIF